MVGNLEGDVVVGGVLLEVGEVATVGGFLVVAGVIAATIGGCLDTNGEEVALGNLEGAFGVVVGNLEGATGVEVDNFDGALACNWALIEARG